MEEGRHIVQVFVGAVSHQYESLSIEVHKNTLVQEIVTCIVDRLELQNPNNYYLAEVVLNGVGEECKERRLGINETPVGLQMLWPQSSTAKATHPPDTERQIYRFCLREKPDQLCAEPSPFESEFIRDYFKRFLYCQPKDKEYPDLCQLNNLTEETLLQNLKVRFDNGQIYTYVGSILISVNPFKYYPIYNPKYVKLYQNHRMGELPPHIFAIADSAYHSMVKQRKNQCIVISGESGSGKTESTLFLLHHLTMLSQNASHGSGVEQTILSSGPVLEAFGNAKTKHNDNSSRFGKFIQVSYKENGLVQGACVQKYLLEKSRICSQALNERSYHVFYYLLAGASPQERSDLTLLRPRDYSYLNQSKCYSIEGCDEQFEFLRLKQSMGMVGFTQAKQQRLFSVLSAVLLLGNVEFQQSRVSLHHDESVVVRNPEVVSNIASLLGVANSTLVGALTAKRARVQGEVLVINYRQPEALMARDALAKCLYGALFDWIVLQLNYSLLSLRDTSADSSANSIGVLDIFGFEDFVNQNRFEQFCINYANERLQHYFNQHVFEYEQEEYQREGIAWTHIEFQDNVDCLALIEGKPTGLLCILDDQCSFPGASDETFLQKINSVHKNNEHYEVPQKREAAFVIHHYAGPVKYQVSGIREKNLDLMRPELITVLKHSRYCVVRELAGADPVAVFRWAILRAFCRAVQAFKGNRDAAQTRREQEGGRHKGNQSRSVVPKVTIEQSRIQAAIENTQNRLRRTRYSRSGSGSLSSQFRRAGHGGLGGGGSGATAARHKNLRTVKALAQRTQGPGRGGRKLPHTVIGQFQLSLQALMDTLGRANPYFIRCIKSNASKEANMFDDHLVMRQLRYTGMLETVRIRQAGYNVRLTYEEFIQHYRILLPKGLLSSQVDVKAFLSSPSLQLDATEHQEGHTRVFMRESQREKLDSLLHQTILSRILLIQRWYRARHQRRVFLSLRAAAIRLQCCVRRWLAEQYLARLQLRHRAATCIQRYWRGYRQRTAYQAIRRTVVGLQAAFRGNQARARFHEMALAVKQRRSSGAPHHRFDDDSSASLTTLTSNLTITSDTSSSSPPKPSRGSLTTTSNSSETAARGDHEATSSSSPKEITPSPSRRRRHEPASGGPQPLPTAGSVLPPTAMTCQPASSSPSAYQPLQRSNARADSLSSLRSESRQSSVDTDSVAEDRIGKSRREHQHRTEQHRIEERQGSSGSNESASATSRLDQFRTTRTSVGPLDLDQGRLRQREAGSGSHEGADRLRDDVVGRRRESISSPTESTHVKKEPARRYHSYGDIGSESSELNSASSSSPYDVPPSDEFVNSKNQKPPPRRRSSTNVGSHAQSGGAGRRRQSEQWHPSRRPSALVPGQEDPPTNPSSAHNSPPSSPGSEQRWPSGPVDAAAGGRAHSKTKSFRHRPYPKRPHGSDGSASTAAAPGGSEEKISPTGSQESFGSGEDDVKPSHSSSYSLSVSGGSEVGGPPASALAAADTEDSVYPSSAAAAVAVAGGNLFPVAVSGPVLVGKGSRTHLAPAEASAGPVSSSKHKYNLKKTFKSIMGKSRDGSSMNYVTDDDNSSLSCGDSVPPTPTLDHPPSLPPPTAPSLDASLNSVLSDITSASLNTIGSNDTLLQDPDTSQPWEPSIPPRAAPPVPPQQQQQDIKKVLAKSPHFLKQSQLKKGDTCAACGKVFTNFFLKQGYKCVACRLVFHHRCVELTQNIPCHGGGSGRGSVPSLSSTTDLLPGQASYQMNPPATAPGSQQPTSSSGHSPHLHHRHSIAQLTTTTAAALTASMKGAGKQQRGAAGGDGIGGAGSGGRATDQENRWNLTGTSQFEDKSVEVITDVHQLQALQEFITRKLFDLQMQYGPSQPTPLVLGSAALSENADFKPLDNREKKDSQVDQLFMTSLRNFKEELVSQSSVAMRSEQPGQSCSLKYKDLTNTFERIMTTVSRQQLGGSTFPVTMGVNAFRGFIDEFLEAGAGSGKKRRRRQNRRKKKEKKPVEEVSHGSHKFAHIMVNIPTLCEVCNSFLWLSAKGLSCRSCKLTCHEKCLSKVETSCSPSSGKALVVSGSTPKTKGSGTAGPMLEVSAISTNRVFGVALERQLLVDRVPQVVDRLIYHIEMGGLYTEGLYRKSAASSKVREVKALIEEDLNLVPYSDLPVHVLTTLLKAFLRELPEPLLTYDAYDPLLHASLLSDPEEQCIAAYRIIEGLPSLNFTLVERLFFHLARVAHQESHNRMNCNSLAIVFSPCIVRSTRALPVTESLNDVSKQTQVIERVISRRLAAYRATLAQIDTIDSEAVSAGARLYSIRETKQKAAQREDGAPAVRIDPRLALQEYTLEEQITNLQEERDRLTQELPDLIHAGSSEEDMLDISRAGSEEDLGSVSSLSSVGRTAGRSREERYSGNNDRYSGGRDWVGAVPVRSYGAEGGREDVPHSRGQSLKERGGIQAPPRRRHAFGRQLSEDPSLTSAAAAASRSATDACDQYKRRRHAPPATPPGHDEMADDDDDTVMV